MQIPEQGERDRPIPDMNEGGPRGRFATPSFPHVVQTQMQALTQVLEARDRRAERQREWLQDFQAPVLSLTLVSPGPCKDSPGRRRLMDMAEARIDARLRSLGVETLATRRTHGPAGPEALRAVAMEVSALKHLAMAFEASAPWGRLVDADVVVLGADGMPRPITRRDMGQEPRRCLVCGDAASACIRERRHLLSELQHAVDALLHPYAGGLA